MAAELIHSLLETMPAALGGRPTLRLVEADGTVVRCLGPDDGAKIVVRGGRVDLETTPGRVVKRCDVARGRRVALLSLDAAAAPAVAPFLVEMFGLLEHSELIEEDLESIHCSSLALLEEVAMLADTLPKLPTGGTDVEIVAMGLESVVVAASLNRALYVQYHPQAQQCEILVQVGMDANLRQAVRIPYAGDPVLRPSNSIVWQALQSDGDALLEPAPPKDAVDAVAPDSLAEREIIAVPVSYGSDAKRVTLGVLLIMDKRASAYSHSERLGSQETKLATALASMLGSVLGTRKVAELGKELHTAREIQQQILPARPARIPGFDVAGRCSSPGAFGGDYFDFLPMADGRTLVVVADVAGHDLASGMLMVGARATLRTLVSKQTQVNVIFDDLAAALYDDLMRTERFITAVATALTPHQRQIEIVSAGHNDSMIYRAATGQVERIPSSATVLGMLQDSRHMVTRSSLAPGDVLLQYTDGVVEAADASGEMLGEERLAVVLSQASGGSAETILRTVFTTVGAFADRSAGDDITAVVTRAL